MSCTRLTPRKIPKWRFPRNWNYCRSGLQHAARERGREVAVAPRHLAVDDDVGHPFGELVRIFIGRGVVDLREIENQHVRERAGP